MQVLRIDTPSCKIMISYVHSLPNSIHFALIYNFYPQYYQASVGQNQVYSLSNGFFSNLHNFFDYLHEIRSKIDHILSQKQGLIKIKLPNQQSYILLQANLSNQQTLQQNQQKYQLQIGQQSQKSLQDSSAPQTPRFIDGAFINGDEDQEELSKLGKQHLICYRAVQMIKEGANSELLAETLKISELAAKKIIVQFLNLGKIYLPKGPKPDFPPMPIYPKSYEPYQFQGVAHSHQNLIQLSMGAPRHNQMQLHSGGIGFNTKLPNQTVEKIKKIILGVIREGKMQSYEEMQQYLQKMNIYRSLSSIYRHVNSLKSNFPQLQSRNFAMHKKDVFGLESAQLTTKEGQK